MYIIIKNYNFITNWNIITITNQKYIVYFSRKIEN